MRTGALLLLLGLGLGCASACTTANPPDEDCITAGGLCFTSTDPAACGTPLPNACSTGYTCCSTVAVQNLVDAAVRDSAADHTGAADASSTPRRDAPAAREAGTTTDASADVAAKTDSGSAGDGGGTRDATSGG